MRSGWWLAGASVLALAACSPSERSAEYSDDAVNVEIAPAADQATAAAAPAEANRSAADAAATTGLVPPVTLAPPAPIAKIAYAFSYALSVPRDRGAELMSRHELTCAAAGAGYCQVVLAQADWTSRSPAGRLELRGQPDWINRFRSGLATDARDAGGRLEEAVTNGEDVTRGIDTATTGAATTASLADRIKALQAQRGGTMAQRLEVERQLADLQRQLDAQRLEARALNDRVQSATLTIDYRQGGVFAAGNPARPVAQALSDAFGLSMGMLAILITLGSVALPIAAIGGVVWWAMRKRRKPATAAV